MFPLQYTVEPQTSACEKDGSGAGALSVETADRGGILSCDSETVG